MRNSHPALAFVVVWFCCKLGEKVMANLHLHPQPPHPRDGCSEQIPLANIAIPF